MWTSHQLDTFRIPNQFLPSHYITSLQKLFRTIGGILTDTVAVLWQSRQLALTELAHRMREEPDPGFTEPAFLHTPLNTDLIPLTRDELTELRKSALLPVTLPSRSISHKTSWRIKLSTALVVAAAPSEGPSTSGGQPLTDDLPSESKPIVAAEILAQAFLTKFKQSKKKKPKAHPQLTLPQRFNIIQIRKNRKKRKGVLLPSDSFNTPNSLTLLNAGPIIAPCNLLDRRGTTLVLPSPPRKSKRSRSSPLAHERSNTTPRCSSYKDSMSSSSPGDRKVGSQNPILGDDPG